MASNTRSISALYTAGGKMSASSASGGIRNSRAICRRSKAEGVAFPPSHRDSAASLRPIAAAKSAWLTLGALA
jgi:hypothetical protein